MRIFCGFVVGAVAVMDTAKTFADGCVAESGVDVADLPTTAAAPLKFE